MWNTDSCPLFLQPDVLYLIYHQILQKVRGVRQEHAIVVGLPVAGVVECERKRILGLPVLWDAEGARNACRVQEGLDKLLEGYHVQS